MRKSSFEDNNPDFLQYLYIDWKATAKVFANEAYHYLSGLNLPVLAALSKDQKDDCIQEIICQYIGNECEKLKQYQDLDRPFKHWFNTGAIRKALELTRKHKPYTELSQTNISSDDDVNTSFNKKRFMDIIDKGTKDLSTKCRLMITAFYRGYSFKEIASILKYTDKDANKKASDDFTYCKKKLKKWILDQGMNLDELLSFIS